MCSLQESLLFSLVYQICAVQVFIAQLSPDYDSTDLHTGLVQGCDIIRTPLTWEGSQGKHKGRNL